MPYVFVSGLDHAGWSGDDFDARKQTNASLDPGNLGRLNLDIKCMLGKGRSESTGVISRRE